MFSTCLCLSTRLVSKNMEADIDHYPFEIHITVKHGDVDLFRATCQALQVKPILLDLEKEEVIMKDMMTSSTTKNTFTFVEGEILRISDGLKESGFEVIRVKVETTPSHPMAPQEISNLMPKDCYFESHIGIILDDEEQEGRSKRVAKTFECHLSQNVFKKNSDGKQSIKMMTFRKYDGTSEDFISDVKKIREALEAENISYEKVIHEFALYDSKVDHDSSWIEDQTNLSSE